MAFQFLCPEGHLLQAEEPQAGQQCACPYCGTLFLIPQPLAEPAAGQGAVPPPGPSRQPPEPPPVAGTPGPSPGDSTQSGFPGIRTNDGRSSRSGVGGPSMPISTDDSPELVHICCPSGHELETPREMLGQMAMCPFCQAPFQLRWQDSVEYRRRKEEEIERKQARAARLWLQWSIAAAAVVFLGLILLVVLSQMQ